MGHIQLEKINIAAGELAYVCGPTGGGKTTLLKRIRELMGSRAGLVMQNPDSQIVNDRVYDELAFGLANQGRSGDEVRRRIAETAGYFGISKWITRSTASLSGGEKQLLAIASVMAMAPEALLLDESTAMLDPVAADRVTALVRDMNRELGITVVLAEHRPDRLFADADKVIWVDGENIRCLPPREMALYLAGDEKRAMFLPQTARIFADENPVPLTLGEAKRLYAAKGAGDLRQRASRAQNASDAPDMLELKRVCFSYAKEQPPVLSEFSLTVKKGEILSLCGENGSGKSTLAYLAAGSLKPYSGSVKIDGRRVKRAGQDSAMLFQDVTCHFTEDEGTGRFSGRHPYDLSGGEQQLLALEAVLAKNPKLLILDEPTKGLDAVEKERLARRLS
ncbi:MAG: energy-coupling factor ABC transporter ATP-binding protein, partial [Butyrivibrio sp.]|nr:energy-coupling factor ABC transporter ATP-binding protein [Butyrivibrio sp.]